MQFRNLFDAEGFRYGIRFHDGSVSDTFNGSTQRQRATEALAELRKKYPTDNIRLVRRRPGKSWEDC